MIKLIVATAKDNLIGKGKIMPWSIPAEFKHFRKTTIGHSLLFGQTTFNNLPKKLEGRKIYVLGHSKTPGADVSITSEKELQKVFDYYQSSQETLFISGGKSIYEQFYTKASELIISRVKVEARGDVYLNLNLENYDSELIKEHKEFSVYKYTKKD